MALFIDLPDELLPFILQYIVKPHHLALLSLVNKNFRASASPILYKRISIFSWHKGSKIKATKVFETLADRPTLARYVKSLEVRDFPKSILQRIEGRNEEILNMCLRGIRNCVNLQACVWTRDGTMNSPILEELSRCRHLDSLELNGHHNYSFDPILLLNFHQLRRLSIIMPSGEVLNAIPTLLVGSANTLESLSLICRSSSLVTDEFLSCLSPSLHSLRSLSLAGCTKVTHQGVKRVLSTSDQGLQELSLEALSPLFDLNDLGRYCVSKGALRSLESVTLSIPHDKVNSAWFSQVEAMLSSARIQKFHVYATGSRRRGSPVVALDETFVKSFVIRHQNSLTRLAVLRFPLTSNGLRFIVEHGTELEELFVTMKRTDFEASASIFSSATKLRSLHITFPVEFPIDEEDENSNAEEDMQSDPRLPFVPWEQLLHFASQLSPTVHQFGVLTRVWRVERRPVEQADGSVYVSFDLAPYESPDIPGIFLVIRT